MPRIKKQFHFRSNYQRTLLNSYLTELYCSLLNWYFHFQLPPKLAPKSGTAHTAEAAYGSQKQHL